MLFVCLSVCLFGGGFYFQCVLCAFTDFFFFLVVFKLQCVRTLSATVEKAHILVFNSTFQHKILIHSMSKLK